MNAQPQPHAQPVPQDRRGESPVSHDLRALHDKLFTLIKALQDENELLRDQLVVERGENQARKFLDL